MWSCIKIKDYDSRGKDYDHKENITIQINNWEQYHDGDVAELRFER